MSHSLELVKSQVVKQVSIAFDLQAKPELFPEDLPKGIRLPGCFDLFELSTRVILGQQISVKAASTLARRVVDLLGIDMLSPWEEIMYHFPSAELVCHLDRPITDVLGEIGVIKNRSNTILAIAKEINNGEIELKELENVDIIRDKLLAIKGIGPWSAEYLLMRGYSWPDAFLVTDLGIKNSLADILVDDEGRVILKNDQEPILSKYRLNKKYMEEALKYAEKYRPYRSYFNISLWQSLNNN